MSEAEAIVDAMEAQGLHLLDTIAVDPPAAASAAPPARRGAPVAAAPLASPSEVELTVPVAEGESAVVLVDNDGVYEWQLPVAAPASDARIATPAARHRSAAAPAGTLVFRIGLPAVQSAVTAAPAPRSARPTGLARTLDVGQALVYVFRFVARPLLGGLTQWLERDVKHSLVRITGPDPQAWQSLPDEEQVSLPTDRAARVLLLVHGTFSSTVGSFRRAGRAAGRP
jgi:hypothetical protein